MPSVPSTLTKDAHVWRRLIERLKSPSETAISASRTASDSILMFSYVQISDSRCFYALSSMCEKRNLTHLEASGSMILAI